jgi:ribosomal protein S18 acetylase RimI-like enzyme
MTEVEYTKFKRESIIGYKDDKIKANGFTEEEAHQIANNDFENLLPDGYLTKDHFFFAVESPNLEIHGHLWYAIRGATNNQKAYIYDIFLNEGSRGKGHGKKTMSLLEDHVKSQGLSKIALHVFGFNEVAIGLYKSLNYKTTDLIMEKSL